MKKKLIVFVLAMLCLMVAVLGTAAYYTADVTTHNVITSGNIKVKLVELGEGDKEFEDIEGAMPGMDIAKVVKARNVGKGDAWVRIRLTKTVEAGEGVTAQLDGSLVTLDINSKDWTERDGWYYYNGVLAPGAYTTPVISTVSLADDMENEWQNAKIIIDVYMQATQVANNGTSALTADVKSWPAED